MRHARILRLLFVILLVAIWSPLASAQQATDDEPVSRDDASGEVVTGDGEVDVDEEPSDRRIERRLTEILEATDRFQDLTVEAKDGVIFLGGVAASPDDRQLAADLAKRTAGVAAVVNNLDLPETPLWTLQPAADELMTLLEGTIRSIPLLVAGILTLALFVLVARTASGFAARMLGGSSDSELLQNVLRKAVYLVIIVVGIYLALRITGLTRIALTVISGTGLLGLALGFAFRDIAENFLASLLLSIQRPFRLGDVVEVDGHTGIVRKVTSRGTLLIDFDGNHIQIANATVYKNTIKNFTSNPLTRISFRVGIGYDDTITEAQETVRRMLVDHEAVLNDPEPLVLVEELGSSTVNLRVYFWINGAEHSMLKMQSSVIRLTVRALTDAGISMPDEAREVIFPQGVPVQLPSESTRHALGNSLAGSAFEAPRPSTKRAVQTSEVAVDAEGDLATETRDLQKQADEARDPEEGVNVLEGPSG